MIFLRTGQIPFSSVCLPREAAAEFCVARSGVCCPCGRRCRQGARPSHQPCLFAGSSHRAGLASLRSQAPGKGFEEQCVPEEGNQWSAHPGEQL